MGGSDLNSLGLSSQPYQSKQTDSTVSQSQKTGNVKKSASTGNLNGKNYKPIGADSSAISFLDLNTHPYLEKLEPSVSKPIKKATKEANHSKSEAQKNASQTINSLFSEKIVAPSMEEAKQADPTNSALKLKGQLSHSTASSVLEEDDLHLETDEQASDLTDFNAANSPTNDSNHELNLKENTDIQGDDLDLDADEKFTEPPASPSSNSQHDDNLDLDMDEKPASIPTINRPSEEERDSALARMEKSQDNIYAFDSKESKSKISTSNFKAEEIEALYLAFKQDKGFGYKATETGIQRTENYKDMNVIYNSKTNKVHVEKNAVGFFQMHRADFCRQANIDQNKEDFEVTIVDSQSWRNLINGLQKLKMEDLEKKKKADAPPATQETIPANELPKSKERREASNENMSDTTKVTTGINATNEALENLHQKASEEETTREKNIAEKKQIFTQRTKVNEIKDMNKEDLKNEVIKGKDQKTDNEGDRP